MPMIFLYKLVKQGVTKKKWWKKEKARDGQRIDYIVDMQG
jgi:hypothetical protein